MLRPITKAFLLIFFLVGSSLVCAEPSPPPIGTFVGPWESRYKMEGVEVVDVLTIAQTGQDISGTYRGSESVDEEDHPWYFFVRVQELTMDEGGTIAFTIGPRNVYARRPTVVDEPNDRRGGTRPGTGRHDSSFRLIGRIDDGVLYLACYPGLEPCDYGAPRAFRKRRE